MKGKLISLLIIGIITLANCNVWAVACGDSADGCPADHYCTTDTSPDGTTTSKCVRCDSSSSDYPFSDAGATSYDQCYNKCEDKKVDHGTWAPNSEKVYSKGKEQCKYTNANKLKCDTDENNPCNGFHVTGTGEDAKCITNKTECTGTNGKGYSIYPYSTCYITTCDSGYHLENTNTTSCGDTYGECQKDEQLCTKFLGNCKDALQWIEGNAVWQSDNNSWDFSGCVCFSQQRKISNGMGNKTCDWESGQGTDTKWYTDDEHCKTEVTSCAAGYCLKPDDNNADSCDPAPAGYYTANSNTTHCFKCPAGSTSNGTVTENDKTTLAYRESACHLVRGDGGTVFCDGNGCFTLPGSGNISWAGN